MHLPKEQSGTATNVSRIQMEGKVKARIYVRSAKKIVNIRRCCCGIINVFIKARMETKKKKMMGTQRSV
jgi:hypothetical protein